MEKCFAKFLIEVRLATHLIALAFGWGSNAESDVPEANAHPTEDSRRRAKSVSNIFNFTFRASDHKPRFQSRQHCTFLASLAEQTVCASHQSSRTLCRHHNRIPREAKWGCSHEEHRHHRCCAVDTRTARLRCSRSSARRPQRQNRGHQDWRPNPGEPKVASSRRHRSGCRRRPRPGSRIKKKLGWKHSF